ncbi:MAG TPA: ABC transporter ATP-binding protein [Candidatus Saccharimonadales bacterium]|nr:ABC transporter ATP-binding protein [Candidatus Saccharimonadales bacterium]
MEQQRNVHATKLAVKHYLQQMKLEWWRTGLAFVLPGVGSILVAYIPPLIIARILVRFGQQAQPNLEQLIPYILLFAGVWAAGEICWRIGINFLIKSETRGMERLYNDAMSFLFAKDLAFFHNNFAGSLTKKVIGYGRKYEDLMDTLSFNVFSYYLPIPFVAVVLWRYSPWLVVALLGLLILTGFIIFPLIKRRQKLVAKRETASNIMAGHVADMIGNIDTIKSFAHESEEAKTHQIKVKDYIKKAKRSWDYQNLTIELITSPFYVLTNTVGLVLALIISHHGIGSLETIFVSFSYFSNVTQVMWNFNQVYRNIESSITEGAQFTELLLEPPSLTDRAEPQNFSVTNGEIEFRNVHFRYSDGAGHNLFEELNFKIKAGEKVAFVGHSGGGKTTITRLLLRFMDVNDGQILIDGQNTAQVAQHDLRTAIAYVPQEPAMFHRSLADNIRYGKLQAKDSDVIRAAKLAHAHEFIKDLSEGYETLVGERGVKLSGGQRQRVAIARAILKNAPILVLDEATSALDSESEHYIQDALWKLMEGKTTIAIAHRLSTIQKMDRIIVLDEGKIAEQGSHLELIEKGGIYAKLWSRQSGGFLED